MASRNASDSSSGRPAPAWTHESDIVCVGGGASGCTAAVTAVSKGNQVILLERAATLGGTSRKSGGVAWIPNNQQMREQGIEDRKEDCMRYMCRYAFPHRYTSGRPMLGLDVREYRLLEAFYDSGSEMIQHLADVGAVRFGTFVVGGQAAPDYADHLPENKAPTGRALAPKDAQGNTLAGILENGGQIIDACGDWLLRKGATILTQHRATRLIREDGRVIGIEAISAGRALRIRARKAVIFATGGFAHNAELIEQHQRMLYGSCAVAEATGDFVDIATEAGARLGQMGSAWRTQVVLEEALRSRVMNIGVFFVPSDSMILVNKHGVRCVNEKRNYNDRTRAHFAYDPVAEDYPNQLLFMIFDARTRDAFGGQYPIPDPAQQDPAYLVQGADLAALAESLRQRLGSLAERTGGVKLAAGFAAKLAETVRRFNEFARTGRDLDFDRGLHAYDREWQGYFSVMREGSRQQRNNMPNATMYPLADQGPYYAVILAPGALDTNSGPMINDKAQVLGPGDHPIAGLYAAGNCVASPTRDAYFGAGGTLGPGMTFAYIAALNAAAERATAQ